MYIICYGKSPKALSTGQKLIGEIGGRFVTGTELITGSFVLAESETACAIIMLLPLEAAIRSMEETITDKTRDLPVIAVSPDGGYAAILRRGNKPYEQGTYDVYSAVVKVLGPFCFSGFEKNAGITNDLTGLISGYSMAVNDPDVLEKMNIKIRNGYKINVYTDLPIVYADPVIDPITYSLHSYPYDMRDDFIRQYRAAKEGKTEASVFITYSYLGDEEDNYNLILVPKILSIGVEIKTKTDPEYCCPAVRTSLIKHLVNPKSVSKIASTYSARDSEIIKGIANDLGSEIVSYGSDKLAGAKVPMEMSFSPDRRKDTSTALAFLASRGGNPVIRRASSVKGLVVSVAVGGDNIILP